MLRRSATVGAVDQAEVIQVLTTEVPLLARTPEEIRAEVRRALEARLEMVAEGDTDEVSRIDAHVAAYRWLLGNTDIAPYTGRRVLVLTARDLAFEQSTGRDHAEQNTHAYNDPVRLYPEAVFDAIAWAPASSTTLRRATEPRDLTSRLPPGGQVQFEAGREVACAGFAVTAPPLGYMPEPPAPISTHARVHGANRL
jgi:hypothetical protein